MRVRKGYNSYAKRHVKYSSLRVLVVDNDTYHSHVMLAFLKSMETQITLVRSVVEARRAWERQSYDLLLLHMPAIHTQRMLYFVHSLRKIRQRCRMQQSNALIVALMANADAQKDKVCLQSGVDCVVSKPYRLETVKEILDLTLANS